MMKQWRDTVWFYLKLKLMRFTDPDIYGDIDTVSRRFTALVDI